MPRQSAVDHGPDHVEIEGRLTDELTSVIAAARRRALRDGDRQIDTAHLLHTLLESDPDVRALFDGPQVARLLGYLVQRSIGYGLRWQIGVEDAVVQTCVSPSARYLAVLVAPAAAQNSYDDYRLPLPERLQTRIVEIDDGTQVVSLQGFDISWCQVPPR